MSATSARGWSCICRQVTRCTSNPARLRSAVLVWSRSKLARERWNCRAVRLDHQPLLEPHEIDPPPHRGWRAVSAPPWISVRASWTHGSVRP